MFFEIHEENLIGYKELTNADLGKSSTSHQTHIGLFGNVFTFMPNSIEIPDSLVIYNNSYSELPVFFDRIENPDGTFRSPKIRLGRGNGNSVVSFIRTTAAGHPNNLRWYLFWFGLKSERPVFFLFNDGSQTYTDICNLGIDLQQGVKKRLNAKSSKFFDLLNYLVNILNSNAESLVEELEVLVQIDPNNTPKKYRDYDLDLAMKSITKIGRDGEAMINNYLASLRTKNEILDYVWENEKKEKGLPYDFYYKTLDGRTFYLDVKTTNHKFGQKMIFSGAESDFVGSENINYQIFRVYCEENGNHLLKICSNAKSLFRKINNVTNEYRNGISNLASVEGIKFAIDPNQMDLEFGQETLLIV